MSKKIGIITHYYNSTNYGGLLQAYALCKKLNDNGINAEQICYDSSARKKISGWRTKKNVRFFLHQIIRCYHYKAERNINLRKKAIQQFRDSIPHSNSIYTDDNISNADCLYDAFITGSDQVWHPNLFRNVYSLMFSNKPKFSYAASLAVENISVEQLELYKKGLNDYINVSVRERSALRILNFFPGIKLSLDPVFLISRSDWEKMASGRLVDKKYVFTYFLGESSSNRYEARKYADKYNLYLVNIPYLLNSYRKCDDNYGDLQLNNVTPSDFLSLIKNAECIFTDSFHAICFSYLFQRNFYVFKRESSGAMNTRIIDILETLGLNDRYVRSVSHMVEIDYSEECINYKVLKDDSESYINHIVELLKSDIEVGK